MKTFLIYQYLPTYLAYLIKLISSQTYLIQLVLTCTVSKITVFFINSGIEVLNLVRKLELSNAYLKGSKFQRSQIAPKNLSARWKTFVFPLISKSNTGEQNSTKQIQSRAKFQIAPEKLSGWGIFPKYISSKSLKYLI